jgi:hypothetical protein
VDFVSGFRGWKSRKPCNGNRDITKREIPKAKRICVGHGGVSEVDRWHTISEFRGVKSRNIALGFAILRSPKSRQK